MSKNKSPIIEIHGTGIHNRGAELMSIAISEKIKSIYPDAQLVVSSNFGFPSDISRYGFRPTFSIESLSKKAFISLFAGIFTGKTVNPAKVDVVLDASGFAFSDQWGARGAKKLYYKMNILGRSSQLLILMPQALGTFNNDDVKDGCKKLFERAALVFPRDTISYQCVTSLYNEKNNKIKQCPDFTIAVKPKADESIQLPKNFVGIVPNIRMLDKLDNKESYLSFLRKSVDTIVKYQMTPVFIVHDAHEDSNVVKLLGEGYQDFLIVQHEDPQVLKSILGKAQFVIGSRFHALVSTLSQGVPCIGAGWSHKYPELFSDFSTRESLIDDLADLEALENQISLLSQSNYRSEKSNEIMLAATKLKGQINEMWVIVLNEIEQHLNKTRNK
ncbi:polysaccharide pyruvyl transferase family protein [Acinetobacter towneri]|uniref:polysaccharide pyruvyl transferase family protein n=1 Tax=Acinetobacter towneri TaxID=202956 RepID=UPI001CE174C0|nr:polysaccharide pyruvyl transferase family protein [Acinetobacter towneri]MCA4797969.1 polysaccharide pyruvyl transferase family protein [Acinetobacter towneri]